MTEGADVQGQDDKGDSGRAAVRRLLIERVETAGLVRAKGVAADAHKAMLGALAERLAYLSADNLAVLAEVVIDNAGGPQRNAWPSEVMVRQWAHALQAPPPREHKILSWLASIKGPEAEAAGYLVELYRFLVRHGRPPLAYDLRQMGEEAAANNRRGVMVRDKIARDAATPEDRGWLAAYLRDQTEARRLLDEGRARREAKATGEVA